MTPRPKKPELVIPKFPDLSAESALWEAGIALVAGVDEAGRGAWAGPVAAGAVVLPADLNMLTQLQGVRDSKQMTARQRVRWAVEIQQAACAWGIGFASAEEIDAQGIVPATRLAMRRALEACAIMPQHLLIDALRLPQLSIPQTSLIKGDGRSLCIAAASVLAKTARDAWMVELDRQFPAYGFAAHKGYGTAAHQAALRSQGACPQHRKSFAPLRELFSSEPGQTNP